MRGQGTRGSRENGERHLLVLSILLGVSVLKLSEVMNLGSSLRDILEQARQSGISASAIGVFLVVGAYMVFFALVLLTVATIAREMRGKEDGNGAGGQLIAMCIASLGVAYACAFAFAVYQLGIP